MVKFVFKASWYVTPELAFYEPYVIRILQRRHRNVDYNLLPRLPELVNYLLHGACFVKHLGNEKACIGSLGPYPLRIPGPFPVRQAHAPELDGAAKFIVDRFHCVFNSAAGVLVWAFLAADKYCAHYPCIKGSSCPAENFIFGYLVDLLAHGWLAAVFCFHCLGESKRIAPRVPGYPRFRAAQVRDIN